MNPLVIFDLDGTLAESKQPLTKEMALLLAKLLSSTKVAIVSGGALPQFLTQIVAQLPLDANLPNLYLLPTSGAALYEYQNNEFVKIYEERLSDDEAKMIAAAINESIGETSAIDLSVPPHGDRIEYRGSQITLSALGQQAPLTEKMAWDPERTKREELQKAILSRLPGFSVKIGGKTSIDVTKDGIDKAYGVRRLCERLSIPESSALYVGDELSQGGNDAVVYKTGVQTRSVKDPADTARLIESLFTSA